MAIIKVLAGDLRKGQQRIDLRWVKSAELQTEEKLKKLAGSAGWGFAGSIVGGLLTGGIGLAVGGLAGVLSGGNKTEICFSCELEDGRKFLAITDKKTWQNISAILFERKRNEIKSSEKQIVSEPINTDLEESPNPNKVANRALKVNSQNQNDKKSKVKSQAKLILIRFWKWYISGFTSRPDKALYESPRFYRILLTFFILSLIGNFSPNTSVSSNNSEKLDTVKEEVVRIGDAKVVEIVQGSTVTLERSSKYSSSGFEYTKFTNIDCSGGRPIAYMNGVPLNGTLQPGSMISKAIDYACKAG